MLRPAKTASLRARRGSIEEARFLTGAARINRSVANYETAHKAPPTRGGATAYGPESAERRW